MDTSNTEISQKTLILAVETSGRIGSIALAAGEEILAEIGFSGPLRHSAELFPSINSLLEQFGRKPKEIAHIYISIGPGSFTGLRIAASFAKTMHLANAAKIVAVDTLDVIAENACDFANQTGKDVKKIATILDAKRGQFFTALYQRQNSRWARLSPDCLMTAKEFLKDYANSTNPLWLLGEGLFYYKDRFNTDGIKFIDEQYWKPKASKLHKLGCEMALAGRFTDALTLQPHYLRKPVAKNKAK